MPNKLTNEEYKDRIYNKFGDRLDLSNVYYDNMRTIINPICSIHGEFSIIAQRLLVYINPCPDCSVNFKLTYDKIIKLGNIKHNNEYEYPIENIPFKTNKDKINIICNKHGKFLMRINSHLSGIKCPKCAEITRREKLSDLDHIGFMKKSNKIHDFKYKYISEYERSNMKVEIECPEHGIFKQEANSHMMGHGCPKCAHRVSKPETEVAEFVKSLNLDILTSKRNIIKPLELDIFIPSLNKAIEFNGTYWHYSKKLFRPGYHAMKSNLCKEKGIKLLHIREDLWIRDKEQMKEVISKFLKIPLHNPN